LILKCTNNFLELLILEIADQPLRVSISISMSMLLQITALEDILESKKNNIFTNFLLGATIQDGSIRERSNDNNSNFEF